jgi:hypothetical protein
MVALLAATVLMGLAAPAADAGLPHARHYHVHGRFTLDTNLLSKSRVSAWAIDAYLRSHTSLPPLGTAFLAAERKYGVNARFLLAAAMHESAWGRGAIARFKHNLFGYNAYDRDPFRYATAYATYAANINATARFIRDFYLTPGGRWWGGRPTMRSMQQFWSSSGRWGENVSAIASSIRLDGFVGRSLKVAAPVVSGPLHGGDRASVRIAWTGGTLPRAMTFVATWEPVADSSTASVPPAATSLTPTAPSLPAAATTVASDSVAPTTVNARRARTRARMITLSVGVPRRPGLYRLRIETRDTDRRPLPAYQRVRIPGVRVRVWGDRAVSVDLEPGTDGAGARLRITNMGREAIPAATILPSAARGGLDAQVVRSLVSVTAVSDDPDDPAPVPLLSAALAADLRPGASIGYSLPAVGPATGRTTNWLSVGLSVLGDPAWLSAITPAGAWVSTALPGSLPSAQALVPGSGILDGGPPPSTPTASAVSSPITATGSATPSRATPAHRRVKRHFSERSGRIVYRGSWANAAHSGYIGGNVRYSAAAGSTARFTFTGSSVRWIGPKGPTRGRALILIDGRAVASVDLWSSSFVSRSVLYSRTFRKTGRHTLTIKVLSTPGRPYVAIDELDIKP